MRTAGVLDIGKVRAGHMDVAGPCFGAGLAYKSLLDVNMALVMGCECC